MRCQYISYFWMMSLMVCLFQEYIYVYTYYTLHKTLGHYGLGTAQGNWKVLFSSLKLSLEANTRWHIVGKLWKHKAPVPFLIEHYWGTFLYAVPQIRGGGINTSLTYFDNNELRVNINIYKNKDCLANFLKSQMWSIVDILGSEKLFYWVFKSKVHISSLHSSSK